MKPENGLTTDAYIERVIDGDTVEISIKRTFHLRLKNFLAPEKNTPDGKISKSGLTEILPVGSQVTVFIPTNNSTKLMDVNSFDRILGIIWKDNDDVRDLMLSKGYGRYVKPGEKPHEGV